MGKPKGKNDQPKNEGVTPLLAPLQALQDLISAFNDQGVIIGGIAVSLLGTPRYTVDLDAVFLIGINDILPFLKEAEKLGIAPRISNPEEFAKKNRILLLRHLASGTDIDLSLGVLPFEIEMVERSVVIDVGEIQLRLPTPEDLIIMKAVAHRPKDMEDIRILSNNHPDLDKKRIQGWVQQFGDALEIPDLWNRISPLLQIDNPD